MFQGKLTLLEQLIQDNWQRLLLPNTEEVTQDFFCLLNIKKMWFTERPKVGEMPDSFLPCFRVRKSEKIGEALAYTKELSFFPMIAYSLGEMKQFRDAIGFGEANAFYILTDPVRQEGKNFLFQIQFYHIELDVTQRVMTPTELLQRQDLLKTLSF